MGWTESGGTAPKGKQREKFDPDEYVHAKKKLKKAVLEHYRGLELLDDYRVGGLLYRLDHLLIFAQILNITGFRKALKKFEKVTNIPVQTTYMKEKVPPFCISVLLILIIAQVENSAFASDDSVKVMIHDMEEQFAARFCE
jgi:xenotropic and polytropic retrovirus receptor 1